ncbi:MAG: hypothetical protein H6873_03530 [Hyphomicrobiaceae bacterium]|nr:hypothetical protein [Hyphomicrobiaceae bacterium]
MKLPQAKFVGSRDANLTVACIARCRADDVIRFVCAHVEIGVSKILLYDDGIADIDKVTRLPNSILRRVEIIPVKSLIPHRDSIDDFNDVQRRIYTSAYLGSETEWFAAIDVDEIIAPIDQDLRTQLEFARSRLDMISLPPAEMVWPIGAGNYHSAWSAPVARLRLIFRPRERNRTLLSKGGFTAHMLGKSIVRTRLDVEIDVHGARRVDGRQLNTDEISALLLHFDAISLPRWIEKARRSITQNSATKRSRRRTMLFHSFVESGDTGEVESLFREHFCLAASRIQKLNRNGAILGLDRNWRFLFRFPITFHRVSRMRRLLSRN